MAAKLSFELDAGKVIAKLHLGGCETYKDVYFYNTGVVDNQDIKPEQADKSKITFDLDGSGEYELGVASRKPLLAKFPFSAEDLKDKAGEAAADSEDGGQSKEDEKDGPDKNDEKAKAEEKHKADEKTPITQNPDEPESKSRLSEGGFLEFLQEASRKNYAETQPDPLYGFDPTDPEEDKKAKELAAQAPKEVAAALEKNRDSVKKFMEIQTNNAYKYIKAYMTAFCGAEEAAKIKPDSIKVTFLPDGFQDPYKVKKYDMHQIPALTDEQVREKKKQMLGDEGAKEYDMRGMCFKIAYSVDLGK